MFKQLKDTTNFTFESCFTFFYKGVFKKDITLEVLDLCEFNYNVESIRYKVLSILIVECIQNVEKYTLPNSIYDSVFIHCVQNKWNIITKNKVYSNQVEDLGKIIDGINAKSEENLEFHLNNLLNLETKKQQSAGLGFVQIVRKRKKPISYSFVTIDDTYSFFYLEVDFNIDNSSSALASKKAIQAKFDTLYEQKTGVYYEGRFSNTVVFPILKILENYLTSSVSGFSLDSKKYHIVIEMIQNISKHGVQNTVGMFCLTKTNKGAFELATCNEILEIEKFELDQYLKNLLEMSREKIALFYNQKMKSEFNSIENGAKLGLPNIIKYSSPNKIYYDFIRISKKCFFYLETEF